MTKHARWAVLLFGLVFGALALAQSVAVTGSTLIQSIVVTGSAVITELSGTVVVQVGNGAPRTLQQNDKIPAGAVVRTGSGARAVLVFADAQVVVLGERTIFRIVDYRFEKQNIGQSGVFLNLIEGSARIVMGAIGQFDPRLVRIQVGAGTLVGSVNPEGGNAADAGVVVQGAATLIAVMQGRVTLTLPSGQGIVLGSGQGALVQFDGALQQGTMAQVSTQAGQTPDGQQMLQRLLALLDMPVPQNQQMVITLATAGGAEAVTASTPPAAPPAEQPPADVPLATTTPPTTAPGGGGGGPPCGASCN